MVSWPPPDKRQAMVLTVQCCGCANRYRPRPEKRGLNTGRPSDVAPPGGLVDGAAAVSRRHHRAEEPAAWARRPDLAWWLAACSRSVSGGIACPAVLGAEHREFDADLATREWPVVTFAATRRRRRPSASSAATAFGAVAASSSGQGRSLPLGQSGTRSTALARRRRPSPTDARSQPTEPWPHRAGAFGGCQVLW